MKIEMVTIGDELTTGTIQDTNFSWLAEQLSLNGLTVTWNQTVRDDVSDMKAAFLQCVGRAQAVIVTGGLGPTSDDLTSAVVADTFQRPLKLDEKSDQDIRRLIESRGIQVSDSQRKQAMIPDGATLLPNEVGTAPGYFFAHQGTTFFFVPGVPREMQDQFRKGILPELKKLQGEGNYHEHRILRCFGFAEAEINERLKQYNFDPVRFSYRVSFPEVFLKLITWGQDKDKDKAVSDLDKAEKNIRESLGPKIYATGDMTLEKVVGDLLIAKKETVALAESCTGGFITSLLTDVPGSSAYVNRGCVVYSNAAKIDLLGVEPELIQEHGAVSAAVAKAMAVGVRRSAQSTYGLAVTGIAGPDGGTDDPSPLRGSKGPRSPAEGKPVGTVHIALATPNEVKEKAYYFPVPRKMFKLAVTHVALHKLRRVLIHG